MAERHRAVLMACSQTGRASWAEFEPAGSGYAWVGNVPAVPDLDAARRGAPASGTDPGADNIPAGSVSWSGWSCGVCGADSTPVPGMENSRFWSCGVCGQLFCTGGYRPDPDRAGSWVARCPGCGSSQALSPGQEVWKIAGYDGRRGHPQAGGSRSLGPGGASGRGLPGR